MESVTDSVFDWSCASSAHKSCGSKKTQSINQWFFFFIMYLLTFIQFYAAIVSINTICEPYVLEA